MGKRSKRKSRWLTDDDTKPVGPVEPVANESNGNGKQAASSSDSIIDPADGTGEPGPAASGTAGDSGDGATGERVRRSYTRRARAPKETTIDLGAFAHTVHLAHAFLASATGVDELAIETDDAEKLANATANVMRHYDVSAVSPKAQDFINLAMVAGMVYGTRLGAWRLRKATERREAETARGRVTPTIVPAPNAPAQNVNRAAPQGNGTVRVQQPGLPPVDVPSEGSTLRQGYRG